MWNWYGQRSLSCAACRGTTGVGKPATLYAYLCCLLPEMLSQQYRRAKLAATCKVTQQAGQACTLPSTSDGGSLEAAAQHGHPHCAVAAARCLVVTTGWKYERCQIATRAGLESSREALRPGGRGGAAPGACMSRDAGERGAQGVLHRYRCRC